MKNKRVAVLMSTYNGEKYIKEQIDSLLKQVDVDMDLIVRDDGSKDQTVNIVKEYMNNHKNIHIVDSDKNYGFARSFWHLLRTSDNSYDYYAFCDQDDIWDKDKLISAINMLEDYSTIPALYTSKVISVNNNMEVLDNNAFPYNKVLNKYESFQKSVVPGCVFVFNNKAKLLLNEYDGYMEAHDWTAYAIINSFGKVVYDNNSHIKYRIHENNTIGKQSMIIELNKKIKRFFKKSKCSRSRFAKDFYNTYNDKISDSEYKEHIKELAFYKEKISYKMRIIFGNHFRGMIFKIYILLNRV